MPGRKSSAWPRVRNRWVFLLLLRQHRLAGFNPRVVRTDVGASALFVSAGTLDGPGAGLVGAGRRWARSLFYTLLALDAAMTG